MRSQLPFGLIALALSTGAAAEEPLDFCTDRPGLGTPACTIGKGRLAVELGILDFERDSASGRRSETLSAGDLLVRLGLSDRLEAQIGWTAFSRTRANGGERGSGVGDVFLAVRQQVRDEDLAVAAMPFVTLPAGSNGFGAGDWGAGLLLPVSTDLPAGFGLGMTVSVEAAVDEDRDGRHLAYGAVLGLDLPTPDRFGATVELAFRRDRDPTGASTAWLGALSGAWSPTDDLQFDVGADLGLDRDTPDVALHLGFARRF
jgi:hypothetical protein